MTPVRQTRLALRRRRRDPSRGHRTLPASLSRQQHRRRDFHQPLVSILLVEQTTPVSRERLTRQGRRTTRVRRKDLQ